MNNHIDTFIIGNITFDDTLGNLKVEVYSGEGDIPHFHLINKSTGFETCICLYSNTYFSHGRYSNRLSIKQCKVLNDWLSKPNDVDNNISNWKMAVNMWEISNRDCKFPEYRKVKNQPHYEIILNVKIKMNKRLSS